MIFSSCFPRRATSSVHPADNEIRANNGIASIRLGHIEDYNTSNIDQPSARADRSKEHFGEDEDEGEVLAQAFKTIDTNGDNRISSSELDQALQNPMLKDHTEFIVVLRSLIEESSTAEIDFNCFKEAADKIPRGRGHRIQWVKTLGLEGSLARRLRIGGLFDGLGGVKAMTREEIKQACTDFCREVPSLVEKGWESLLEGHAFSMPEEANSKFCSTQGAFKGKFASLDLFYQGPESLIGAPNPNLYVGMHREHCLRSNRQTKFTTPNYNFETCSDWEWRFVVCPDDLPEEGFQYPHTPIVSDPAEWNGRDLSKEGRWKGHGRNVTPLEKFLELEIVNRAGLRREEVIALRLYTGPLFVLYNAVLRSFPQHIVEVLAGNRYETTLFCLCSGVTKLSKETAVPPNRLLYRGLGGMLLPDEFWKGAGNGFRGGVEYGLMSTTTSRATAMAYSGIDRKRATVLEIQAGRIDVGASLRFVSQYPGEEEFLMPPLSCLEVVGRPRVEVTAQGEVVVFPLRVNVNLKSVTVEELTQRRKALHLAMLKNLREEFEQAVRTDIEALQLPPPVESPSGGSVSAASGDGGGGRLAEVRGQLSDALAVIAGELDGLAGRHRALEAESYNLDEEYKARTMEAIDSKALALRKMSLFRAEAERGGAEAAELRGRILGTPLGEFGRAGIELQLRTGVAGFPWGDVAAGRAAIDLGHWTPAGLDSGQLERARGVLAECDTVRSVATMGTVVWFREGLLAPEICLDGQPLPVDVEPLAFLLSASTRLASLSLRGCGLGEAGWTAVVGALDPRAPLTRMGGLCLDFRPALAGRAPALHLAALPLGAEGGFIAAALVQRAGAVLVSLDLSGCGLPPEAGTALARCLPAAAALESLALHNNCIGNEGGAALAAGLRGAAALRTVSLRDNGLGYGAWRTVLGALESCQLLERLEDAEWTRALLAGHLEALDLGPDALAVEGVAALGAFLPRSAVTLTAVTLVASGLGAEGCAALAEGLGGGLPGLQRVSVRDEAGLRAEDWGVVLAVLTQCGSLCEINGRAWSGPLLAGALASLDLPGAGLLAEDGAAIGHFLPRSASVLAALDLSHNPSLGDGGCAAFAMGLRRAALVRALHLVGVCMGPGGGAALAEALAGLPVLGVLCLGENALGPEGTTAVAAALRHVTALEELELRSNCAGAAGATSLAAGMRHTPALRVLGLASNGLAGPGATAVANSMTCVRAMGALDLSCNEMDAGGAAAVAEALRHVAGLEELLLGENPLGADGAGAIAGALEWLPALRALDVRRASLGDDGLLRLAEAAGRFGARLSRLGLGDNGGSSATWAQLLVALDGCAGLRELNGLEWSGSLMAGGAKDLRLSAPVGTEEAAMLGLYLPRSTGTLTSLVLSRVGLDAAGATALAEGLRAALTLERLDASRNLLGDAGIAALADAARVLPRLAELSLAGNDGTRRCAGAVGECIRGKTGLARLQLADNALGIEGWATLADAVAGCTALTELNDQEWSRRLLLGGWPALDIAAQGVDGEAAAMLACLLPRSAALTSLNLRDNVLGREGAAAVARGLQALPILEELDLSENFLGPDGAATVGEGLRHASRLRVLRLDINNIGTRGATLLAEGLARCGALEALSLVENEIGWEGWQQVAEALRGCAALVAVNGYAWARDCLRVGGGSERVAFSARGLHGEKVAVALSFLRREACALAALDLSGNDLSSDEAAAALAAGLRGLTGLEELRLAGCQLGDEALAGVGAAISPLSRLRVLCLRSNLFGDEGASAVAQALRALPSLVELDVGNYGSADDGSMGLPADGCAAIADALGTARALRALDVSGAALCSVGGTALAEALGRTAGLRTIGLRGCGLSGVAADAAAEGLRAASGLERLDLRGNALGDGGGTALADALREISALAKLDLGDTALGDAGLAAVAGALLHASALVELRAGRQKLSALGVAGLVGGLGAAQGLRTLDLKRAELGPDAAAALAAGLRGGAAPGLEELILSKNPFGAEGGVALAEGLSGVPGLRVLRAGGCGFGPDGVAALAAALGVVPYLQELRLRANDAAPAGATAVAVALRQLGDLEALLMENNEAGPEGGTAIGAALSGLRRLAALGLACNGLDAAAAAAVASGLVGATALTMVSVEGAEGLTEGLALAGAVAGSAGLADVNGLGWARALLRGGAEKFDLSENGFGDGGGPGILAGLLRRPGLASALVEVNLSGLGLDAASAVAVCDALGEAVATALSTLRLNGCALGVEGGTAMAQALPLLPGLRTLDLSESTLGDEGLLAVVGALGGASRLTRLNLSGCGAQDAALIARARAAVASAWGLPVAVQAPERHEHPLLFGTELEGQVCEVCSGVSQADGRGYLCEDCCYCLCLRCAGRLGVAVHESELGAEGDEEEYGSVQHERSMDDSDSDWDGG